MSNTLGITEVTLAQAADSTHAVNLTPQPESMGRGVTIRITDHVNNDKGATDKDTTRMALFHRKAHGHPWMRKGTHLSAPIWETVDPLTDVIPTNVEVLYPDFDYTTFE